MNTTALYTPPPIGSDAYIRADLWGVTPAGGLPPIPGGATGPAQQRLLTYLLDRYPASMQPGLIKTYGQRGYDTWFLSIPDSIKGPSQLSPQQYVDLAQLVADGGQRVGHFLRSKDWDGPNPDPTEYYGVVDLLAKRGLFDLAVHAWEASLFIAPGVFRSMIDSDATRYPIKRWCIHLQEGYAHYALNGAPPATFWEANFTVGVKTLLYQYVSDKYSPREPSGSYGWPAGMMQARGNDVSVRLLKGGLWGLSQSADWCCFEEVGVNLFNNENDGDGRLATEDTANLKGFETALCTIGPLQPMGFGNGARYPDGSVI